MELNSFRKPIQCDHPRCLLLAATLVLIALAAPADARGGGGYSRGNVGGEHLAGGRQHGNDAYIKAASEEREKLLNTKLKSICRGCLRDAESKLARDR